MENSRKNYRKQDKVLLVSHEMSYTGSPRSLLQIADILKSAGYLIEVWTLKAGAFMKEFAASGIAVKEIAFPEAASENLRMQIETFRLVIANTIFCAAFASYAQRYTNTVLYIREAQNIPQLIKDCHLDENNLIHAENIICVSDYAREFIVNTYRLENVTVIHNYTEDYYQDMNAAAHIPDSETIHFMVSGTIEPRKGQDIALKAFNLLPESLQESAVLHFVGRMPDWAAEYQQNLHLDSQPNVIYHGEIQDRKKLMALYRGMDVILIPSLDESCSLIALEAAMLGKAILLTKNTGAKYLVSDSHILKAGDYTSLAEKMSYFIHKPEHISPIGLENRRRYLKYGTKERYSVEFITYLQRMKNEYSSLGLNNRKKISVIIPVYNVEKYLGFCLDSLLIQTLTDIEFLCINDGSTDNSLAILEQYQKKDSRIRIITINNHGYGYAMNTGIEAASGEYLGIVEPDDYVANNMYEILYHRARATNTEIVKADFYRFYGNGSEQRNIYHSTAGAIDNYNRIICPRYEKECFRYIMNTWAGIYRLDFLRKYQIRHNETPGASFQDNGFWFQGFCHAERITFVNKALYYNRRDNPNSSVNNKGKGFCANEEYSFIRKFLKSHPDLEKEYIYQYSMKKYHTYLFMLNRIDWSFRKEFLKTFSEEFSAAKENGELNREVFTPQEWSDLQLIIHDYEDYYDKSVKNELHTADYYAYCLDEIRKSKSYKIGLLITWLPRKIREWKRKEKRK